MNPFSFALQKTTGTTGSIYARNRNILTNAFTESLQYGAWAQIAPAAAKDASILLALKQRANTKMQKGLKDQSVHLGNAIAEGKQTRDLFLNTANRLATGFRQLKRGDFRGAASAIGGLDSQYFNPAKRRYEQGRRKSPASALANGWLELQYGWKPLLSDIYGSCEFLANKLYHVPRYKETSSSSRTVTSVDVAEDLNDVRTQTVAQEYTVKYVVYFSQSGNHDLSSLGLINPASIAWELTPYSFVVDWMLPIGTWLNNLDATYGLTFVKGCTTEFWRARCRGIQVAKSRTVGVNEYLRIGTLQSDSEYVTVSRGVLSDFPNNPLPAFKNPFSEFNSALDPGDHFLNAMALLKQAFKTR
jgi:hypothetical protein